MRFASFALTLVGLSALAGCATTVTHIRGPSGEPAYIVKCSSSESCYRKASELCAPDGYVLHASGREASGYVIRGNGSLSSRTELVFSCQDDMPAPRVDPGALPPREDSLVCDAAYGRSTELAVYWAKMTPGSKLLDEPPSKRDFVSVCREMPENVQRCLHSKFRDAHVKSCDAVLVRLDAEHRAKIDGLYLQAPGPGDTAKEATKKDADGGAL